MKLQIETTQYNEKRYGKPWIALVDFSTGTKGEFNFGEWAGQAGYAGTLYLDVTEGDIVARGQKDNRKPANSAPDFYIVKHDGELEDISKADAYKAFQSHVEVDVFAGFSDEQLLAEIQKRGLGNKCSG
jgi:hypothetical protein